MAVGFFLEAGTFRAIGPADIRFAFADLNLLQGAVIFLTTVMATFGYVAADGVIDGFFHETAPPFRR